MTMTTDKMSKHETIAIRIVKYVDTVHFRVALFIPRLHLTILTTWNKT